MALPPALLTALLAVVGLAACGEGGGGDPAPGPGSAPDSGAGAIRPDPSASGAGPILAGSLPLLNGEPQDLAAYRGKVVLVVNTASECGFTPQFEGLEELYRSKRSQGFVILGFPADDLAHQEPRDDEAIARFCKANFGVSFPMFAKSNVVSAPLNPVFDRLGAEAGPPNWNFNKYLLARDGRLVEHFEVSTEPGDPDLTAKIDQLLAS